jgi:hypothetical protein
MYSNYVIKQPAPATGYVLVIVHATTGKIINHIICASQWQAEEIKHLIINN